MTRQLTKAQAAQLVRALRARQDGTDWIRSLDNGHRVTLASLHYRGFLDRRAWAKAGTTSPAYEYRLTDQMYDAWQARQGGQS